MAKNSKIKVPAEPGSGKGCSLLPKCHLVAVASHDGRGKGSLKVFRTLCGPKTGRAADELCSVTWPCGIYHIHTSRCSREPLVIPDQGSSQSEVTAALVCATRLPERTLPKRTEQVCLRSLLQCVFSIFSTVCALQGLGPCAACAAHTWWAL